MTRGSWTVDAFETDGGDSPAWSFIRRLEGRQSGALGDGLFELRGKQVRIFYVFLPGRSIMLLDGEIKKRDAIPRRTLQRMKSLQGVVMRRAVARGGQGER